MKNNLKSAFGIAFITAFIIGIQDGVLNIVSTVNINTEVRHLLVAKIFRSIGIDIVLNFSVLLLLYLLLLIFIYLISPVLKRYISTPRPLFKAITAFFTVFIPGISLVMTLVSKHSITHYPFLFALANVFLVCFTVAALFWSFHLTERVEKVSDKILLPSIFSLLFFSVLIFWANIGYLSPSAPLFFLIGNLACLVAGVIFWLTIYFCSEKIGFYRTLIPLSLIVATLFIISVNIPFKNPDKINNTGRKLILISIDTLRSDALSCYGSSCPTPAMDSLALEGILFKETYTQAPWTNPSISSFMTSKYPSQLGMTDGKVVPLSEKETTLAEILSAEGVNCSAILTNSMSTKDFGFFQGFNHAGAVLSWNWLKHNISRTTSLKILDTVFKTNFSDDRTFAAGKAEEVVLEGKKWLEKNGEKDFFLWLHFIDPHDSYEPPAEFCTDCDWYKGELKNNIGSMLKFREGNMVSLEDMKYIKCMYEGEVKYVDYCLQNFFDSLRQMQLWDSSLIILTSDHGEEFWEHGGVQHGHSLYQELITVPFIVKLPDNKNKGIVIDEKVRLIDLVPTIADIFKINPPLPFGGKSLLPLIKGEEWEPIPWIYSEGLIFFEEKKSIIENDFKLIKGTVIGGDELFNLSEDPLEKADISSQSPLLMREMDENIDAIGQALQSGATVGIESEELKSKLKALGYVN